MSTSTVASTSRKHTKTLRSLLHAYHHLPAPVALTQSLLSAPPPKSVLEITSLTSNGLRVHRERLRPSLVGAAGGPTHGQGDMSRVKLSMPTHDSSSVYSTPVPWTASAQRSGTAPPLAERWQRLTDALHGTEAGGQVGLESWLEGKGKVGLWEEERREMGERQKWAKEVESRREQEEWKELEEGR